MFIAKIEEFQQIIRGSQVESRTVVQSTLTCPICGVTVNYNPTPEDRFDYFYHEDGSDCFSSDGASDGHRIAVEVTVGAIFNRLAEVTGKPIQIDVEGRVGDPTDFIIADVVVTEPFQITAEVFYKTGDLALRRRFNTLDENNHRAYLIFHADGRHDVERINKHIQRISPLNVGRFSPNTMDVFLGDLFSGEQIDFSPATDVPNYIYTG